MIRTYAYRIPPRVRAVQLTPDNAEAVIRWIKQLYVHSAKSDRRNNADGISITTGHFSIFAAYGDYIVKSGVDFWPYSEQRFHTLFAGSQKEGEP